MVANILRQLEENEDFFTEFVGERFRAIDDYGGMLECDIVVEDDRLRWAHKEYRQSVSEFSIRLTSGDPDHYKRCGALLRALYRIKPITSVKFDPPLEEFDSLFAPLGTSYADAEYSYSLGRFFSEYHNELTAFSLVYSICAMYETDPTPITPSYIHTMCAYLSSSDNLSADSLYMIFKSLMH